MFGYLRGLTTARLVLWCYLIWYLVVLVRYFDASPALWFNSLGISAIIGTALYLSTAHAGHTRTRLDRWQIFRLYLMPLCVSSFAALIKGRGFVLVLHPDLEGNLLAFGLVSALCAVVWLAKRSAATNAGVNDASCASAGGGLESPRGI
ncbi:MAG TPA: hypothetical protein VHO25_04395 [Polyangiaceae bacterium]|nr:hypothetical protein [Polyangiaceae bacterium]